MAEWLGLRSLDEDAPLVDAASSSFELALGNTMVLRIPMERDKQLRGVDAGGAGTDDGSSETGAVVWDGSVLLCRAAERIAPASRVLELGAGCGAAGIAAALAGARATLSDRPHRVAALEANAAANGVDVACVALDWRAPYDAALGAFDVVLCADCVYDLDLVGPLLRAAAAALAAGGVVLVAVDTAVHRDKAYAAFEAAAPCLFEVVEEESFASRAAWSKGDDKEALRLWRLRRPRRRTVVVMGPCGVGKSTVGAALAAALGLDFLDADDYHPPANVAKMARGEALDDGDRAPWLAAVAAAARRRRGAVVACSALKAAYRAAFDGAATFVFLDVPPAVVRARVARRTHFMPASLVDSQYGALERPDPAAAVVVDGTAPVAALVATILGRLA